MGLLGHIVAERYELQRVLGAGSLGTVYQARHVLIDRCVAIKLIHPGHEADGHRTWLLREARAANRVNHPNIVQVHDVGTTTDGLVYLVMELVEGLRLDTLIARCPLAIELALDVVEQVAAALARAHDLGVIHRDLKPEHIFVRGVENQTASVKIIDFGLAHIANRRQLASHGALIGTPEYMAPEQARGESAGPQADLYALGAVLYEMLTGRTPVEGSSPEEILHAKTRGAPRRVDELRPEAPAPLVDLVHRLLATDLRQRHRDAYHVLDDCRSIPHRIPAPYRPTTRQDPEASSNPLDVVGRWAIRASLVARMVAAAHADRTAPPKVLQSVEQLWRGVADLSRVVGELEAVTRWDENLRQRLGDFSRDVALQIEELSRTESRLRRELDTGRAELVRLEQLRRNAESTRASARRLAEDHEAAQQPHKASRALHDAGVAAALSQVHLQAIDTTGRKIERWEQECRQVEHHRSLLRAQLERHASRIETDLESGRPRFAALVEKRQSVVAQLEDAEREVVQHVGHRPECRALLYQLQATQSG